MKIEKTLRIRNICLFVFVCICDLAQSGSNSLVIYRRSVNSKLCIDNNQLLSCFIVNLFYVNI